MKNLNLPRIDLIHKCISKIEKCTENEPTERRNRLIERLQEIIKDAPVDTGRLEQELAFLAERSDITEELVRTAHHLDYFKNSFEFFEARSMVHRSLSCSRSGWIL